MHVCVFLELGIHIEREREERERGEEREENGEHTHRANMYAYVCSPPSGGHEKLEQTLVILKVRDFSIPRESKFAGGLQSQD